MLTYYRVVKRGEYEVISDVEVKVVTNNPTYLNYVANNELKLGPNPSTLIIPAGCVIQVNRTILEKHRNGVHLQIFRQFNKGRNNIRRTSFTIDLESMSILTSSIKEFS